MVGGFRSTGCAVLSQKGPGSLQVWREVPLLQRTIATGSRLYSPTIVPNASRHKRRKGQTAVDFDVKVYGDNLTRYPGR